MNLHFQPMFVVGERTTAKSGVSIKKLNTFHPGRKLAAWGEEHPLEGGAVRSIGTAFIQREVGHVKIIEDAVAVTGKGCEGLGDLGRDWQIVPD